MTGLLWLSEATRHRRCSRTQHADRRSVSSPEQNRSNLGTTWQASAQNLPDYYSVLLAARLFGAQFMAAHKGHYRAV